jgi:hypothetical protein
VSLVLAELTSTPPRNNAPTAQTTAQCVMGRPAAPNASIPSLCFRMALVSVRDRYPPMVRVFSVRVLLAATSTQHLRAAVVVQRIALSVQVQQTALSAATHLHCSEMGLVVVRVRLKAKVYVFNVPAQLFLTTKTTLA